MATHAPNYEPRRAFAPLTAPPAIAIRAPRTIWTRITLADPLPVITLEPGTGYIDVTAAIQTGAFVPRGR